MSTCAMTRRMARSLASSPERPGSALERYALVALRAGEQPLRRDDRDPEHHDVQHEQRDPDQRQHLVAANRARREAQGGCPREGRGAEQPDPAALACPSARIRGYKRRLALVRGDAPAEGDPPEPRLRRAGEPGVWVVPA